MKAFYELYRDVENKLWVVNRDDYAYPPHFHASVEVFLLKEGKYKVQIDDGSYEMTSKSVSISDSYCIHALTKLDGDSLDNTLLMIPSNYLFDYTAMKNGRFLRGCIIDDPNVFEELYTLAMLIRKNRDNDMVLQPLVNALLARIVHEVGLVEATKQNSFSIIKDILLYIELHFQEDISLKSIAQHFGYTACHLSRVFHSYLKVSISQYINDLRIEWIELNKNSGKKLLALIYESGFNSPQTYYRNLKNHRTKD